MVSTINRNKEYTNGFLARDKEFLLHFEFEFAVDAFVKKIKLNILIYFDQCLETKNYVKWRINLIFRNI